MKKLVYIIAALLSGATAMHAGETTGGHESEKAQFVYDVNFEMNFDNREFYRSRFSESMTIFGARLTPSFGLEKIQADGTSHRLITGIDIMKDFGASPISEGIAGARLQKQRLGRTTRIFSEKSLYTID